MVNTVRVHVCNGEEWGRKCWRAGKASGGIRSEHNGMPNGARHGNLELFVVLRTLHVLILLYSYKVVPIQNFPTLPAIPYFGYSHSYSKVRYLRYKFKVCPAVA